MLPEKALNVLLFKVGKCSKSAPRNKYCKSTATTLILNYLKSLFFSCFGGQNDDHFHSFYNSKQRLSNPKQLDVPVEGEVSERDQGWRS